MKALNEARADSRINERIKQRAQVPRLLATGRLIQEDGGWYRLGDSTVFVDIRRIVWEVRQGALGKPTHVTLW